MIKFSLLPYALCRTPLFSYRSSLEEVWEDLKSAIQEASSELYRLIADTSSTEIGHLDPKVQFACWKYFNRALYRATPFGNFGAITLIPIGKESEALSLTKKQISHALVDWSQKETKLRRAAEILQDAQTLCLNGSLYPCGEDYRYISVVNNTFEISSINQQEILNALFDFVSIKRSKQDLYHFLESQFGLLPAIAEDLLLQLIEAQVLLTDVHPNIIGTDYFERLHISGQHAPKYRLAERKLLKGSLGMHRLKQIPEALSFLYQYLPPAKNSNLDLFKQKFLQRFESKGVPLMQALDPELGVGYGGLESHPINNTLMEELMAQAPVSTFPTMAYTGLHHFILNQLMAHKEEIDLSLWPVQAAGKELQKTELLPANTFSALIQFADDKLLLDTVGGNTANALLGRFTPVSNEVEEVCAHITQLEEAANPDILFFDIGYQAEKHVDNINRRKRIYPYEVPILCWSENEHMLPLADLWICIQNGELILYSKSQSRRLIPRLASAYNYTRSDLAVYRFLTDLQSQQLQVNLSPKLIDLFPDLDYYPSFRYKQVIFSPRMWKVPLDLTKSGGKTEKDLPVLATWLKQNKVSVYFKCGSGDQQLYFNSENPAELCYFLQYCRGKADLYIQETFIPQIPVTRDEEGAPYLEQLIIPLYHQQRLYKPLVKPADALDQRDKKIQLPGSEWLYFEIYLHPSRSNALLCQSVAPLLKHFKSALKSWFFIRYNYPAPHLRLRLQVKEQESISLLLKTFSDNWERDVRANLIQEVQIKTYIREIERYGEKEIEKVERFFHLDSRLILKLLQRGYTDEQLYVLSIRFMLRLFQQLKMHIAEQLGFVKQIGDALARETQVKAEGFRKINTHYQQLQSLGNLFLPQTLEKASNHLLLYTQKLLSSVEPQRRPYLLADLIHMHINRLFLSEQRTHELFVYQFLQKHLLKEHTLKTRHG